MKAHRDAFLNAAKEETHELTSFWLRKTRNRPRGFVRLERDAAKRGASSKRATSSSTGA